MPPRPDQSDRSTSLVASLRQLYESESARAQRFRYGLLIVDVATVLFLIIASFFPPSLLTETVGVAIGLYILADFAARLAISRSPVRDLLHPTGIADMVAIVSCLAPVWGEGFAFLRVLRTLRLLHTYQMVERLKGDLPFFRRHHAVIVAITHLGIFLFVMTALVFETQHWSNPEIRNYADALYFTVTTLTTTGFGDITLPGTTGRLLSVLIMIFGVSLFLRLVQVLFRPDKVEYECPTCGLKRHDPDAVHCKHCGTTLHIETEGAV